MQHQLQSAALYVHWRVICVRFTAIAQCARKTKEIVNCGGNYWCNLLFCDESFFFRMNLITGIFSSRRNVALKAIPTIFKRSVTYGLGVMVYPASSIDGWIKLRILQNEALTGHWCTDKIHIPIVVPHVIASSVWSHVSRWQLRATPCSQLSDSGFSRKKSYDSNGQSFSVHEIQ